MPRVGLCLIAFGFLSSASIAHSQNRAIIIPAPPSMTGDLDTAIEEADLLFRIDQADRITVNGLAVELDELQDLLLATGARETPRNILVLSDDSTNRDLLNQVLAVIKENRHPDGELSFGLAE